MVIKSVGAVSCAKVAGMLYLVIGLVVGALLSMASTMGGLLGGNDGSAAFGALFGVGAIIALPLLYGCLGFVSALIGAWLYNILAAMVGGVEMDVQ